MKIVVYTDHKNLVEETVLMSSDRVMRWWLLFEEYHPEMKYIKGQKNIVADILSRYPTIANVENEKNYSTGGSCCCNPGREGG